MRDKETIAWLNMAVKKYKSLIWVLVLLQIVINGVAVCYALIMKKMIDHAVNGESHGFFIYLISFGLLILLQLALRMLLRHLEELARSGMENALKQRLFDNLMKKDYARVTAYHSEEWMNRLTSDTTVCANGMVEIVPGVCGLFVKLIGVLVLMVVLMPMLAVVLIPCGILFLIITFMLRRRLKKLHKTVQEKEGEVRVYMQERISSMLILRVFGAEKLATDGTKNRLSDYRKARMNKGILSNICNSGFSAAMNALYFVGIGFCGYGILKGTVTYGTLSAIIQLIGQLQTPLMNISGFVPRYFACLASAERLMEVEKFEDTDSEECKSVTEAKKMYQEQFETIEFEKVFFTYGDSNEDREVLKNASITIEKGDFIAIIGNSGGGKSTLLKLLMSVFEPVNGEVTVCTNQGERFPIKKWKRLFAYVPQGNCLMNGTITEAVTFHSADREDGMSVEEALRLACAEFVWELAKGPETVLGERGAGLSEGQMQRIAIARALYADAPILILDEATSALDENTEKRLLEKIKQLTDKTVILVTHRKAALDICNKVLHVADGVVSAE